MAPLLPIKKRMEKEEMNVSSEQLKSWLDSGKDVFILDVRPQEQREEWHIAGSIHLDAYKRLNDGDMSVLDEITIPNDVPVVTVCAAGRTSSIAANELRKKGINAYSLNGGMKEWNFAWNAAEITIGDVTLIQVRRVAKGCLSYIIGSRNEAIVVDASLDPKVYTTIAAEHNWTIQYVLDTHIHADYISRTIELAEATGAVHLFSKNADVSYTYAPLSDGDIITFGSAKLIAVFTPGHTPEGFSFQINNSFLLTGDTLFIDSVGRPDLKADHEQGMKKAEQLFFSIRRLLTLGTDDLLVLPAHTSGYIGFDGRIVGEKLSNLSAKIELLQLEKEAFVQQTMRRIAPTPPNYLQIAALNKAGNHEGVQLADLEAGPNRCAVS